MDFPKAHAKLIVKMELQIRSHCLLIWYGPVPPTLRTTLFLDVMCIISLTSYEMYWPGIEMGVLGNLAGISNNSVIINIVI